MTHQKMHELQQLSMSWIEVSQVTLPSTTTRMLNNFYSLRFSFWSRQLMCCVNVDRRSCTPMRSPSTSRKATTHWYLKTTRVIWRWPPRCFQSTLRGISPRTLSVTWRSLFKIKQSKKNIVQIVNFVVVISYQVDFVVHLLEVCGSLVVYFHKLQMIILCFAEWLSISVAW